LCSAAFSRDTSQEEEEHEKKEKIYGNAEEVREELTTHMYAYIQYNIL
jgi:hypothetical protein